MAKVSYTVLKRKQQMYIKIYAVLCLVVFIAVGFYSYQKWQEYSINKLAVEKNREFISVLQNEVSDEKSIYESLRSEFDFFNKDIEEILSYIFPETDSYTALTRQIDAFEEDLYSKNSPFEISNIEYQTIVEEQNYSILPLRMNIRSSAENFTKFLHLIETSGSLSEQVRLMDISSIKLNFESSDKDEEAADNISFIVQINAYFQKP